MGSSERAGHRSFYQKHFLEYGFERASIREICKDAHVTNGAFYNHFDDKEALFGALVEPVVQEVKAIYEASVNEHMELAKTDLAPALLLKA